MPIIIFLVALIIFFIFASIIREYRHYKKLWVSLPPRTKEPLTVEKIMASLPKTNYWQEKVKKHYAIKSVDKSIIGTLDNSDRLD